MRSQKHRASRTEAYGKMSARGGALFLARWTTDWDCGYDTGWWHCIKDSAFDIYAINQNYRYKIRKGSKQFEVKQIAPLQYEEELYSVQAAAFSAYPTAYRPSVNYDAFIKSIEGWKKSITFGAFFKETGRLCGYAQIIDHGSYLSLSVQKTDPAYEKYQINAAIVYQILQDYDERLRNGAYLCDGERNIMHETAFQDYLEKYFGFRKAFCKLNIAYSPKIKWAVSILYPFRKMLSKIDIKLFKQITAVLKMEEIVRKEQKHEHLAD